MWMGCASIHLSAGRVSFIPGWGVPPGSAPRNVGRNVGWVEFRRPGSRQLVMPSCGVGISWRPTGPQLGSSLGREWVHPGSSSAGSQPESHIGIRTHRRQTHLAPTDVAVSIFTESIVATSIVATSGDAVGLPTCRCRSRQTKWIHALRDLGIVTLACMLVKFHFFNHARGFEFCRLDSFDWLEQACAASSGLTRLCDSVRSVTVCEGERLSEMQGRTTRKVWGLDLRFSIEAWVGLGEQWASGANRRQEQASRPRQPARGKRGASDRVGVGGAGERAGRWWLEQAVTDSNVLMDNKSFMEDAKHLGVKLEASCICTWGRIAGNHLDTGWYQLANWLIPAEVASWLAPDSTLAVYHCIHGHLLTLFYHIFINTIIVLCRPSTWQPNKGVPRHYHYYYYHRRKLTREQPDPNFASRQRIIPTYRYHYCVAAKPVMREIAAPKDPIGASGRLWLNSSFCDKTAPYSTVQSSAIPLLFMFPPLLADNISPSPPSSAVPQWATLSLPCRYLLVTKQQLEYRGGRFLSFGTSIPPVLAQVASTSPPLTAVFFQIPLNTRYFDVPWEEVDALLASDAFTLLERVECHLFAPYAMAVLHMKCRMGLLQARGLLQFVDADPDEGPASAYVLAPLPEPRRPTAVRQKRLRRLWDGLAAQAVLRMLRNHSKIASIARYDLVALRQAIVTKSERHRVVSTRPEMHARLLRKDASLPATAPFSKVRGVRVRILDLRRPSGLNAMQPSAPMASRRLTASQIVTGRPFSGFGQMLYVGAPRMWMCAAPAPGDDDEDDLTAEEVHPTGTAFLPIANLSLGLARNSDGAPVCPFMPPLPTASPELEIYPAPGFPDLWPEPQPTPTPKPRHREMAPPWPPREPVTARMATSVQPPPAAAEALLAPPWPHYACPHLHCLPPSRTPSPPARLANDAAESGGP
ncbi:hypothetical protein GGX14DRAFT_609393 [Mycena pura]|uniref:Uncharacterized protein n=1 Tax=Mycena pura TaxID=153505 RepID=A0AAD6UPD9_9AGAR|nr:hypothetical protein GGX14DRAFT_609393 [Mycena pura]